LRWLQIVFSVSFQQEFGVDSSPSNAFTETEVDWLKNSSDVPEPDVVYVIRNTLSEYYHSLANGLWHWERDWSEADTYSTAKFAHDACYMLRTRGVRCKAYRREYRETAADTEILTHPVSEPIQVVRGRPLGSLIVETDFHFDLDFRGTIEIGRFMLRDLTMGDLHDLSATATRMQQEGYKTRELVKTLGQVLTTPWEDHTSNRGAEWFTHCRKPS
jgi:hypothetical protein